jgi:hypothetical protein
MTKAERKAQDLHIWKELVLIEPQLLELEKDARAFKRATRGADSVCANDRWYGYGEWKNRGLRERLIYLVGWMRKDQPNALLKSSDGYAVAYQHVYGLLPSCRNCGEMS